MHCFHSTWFHLSVDCWIQSRLGFQWYQISNLCSFWSRLKLQPIFECNSSATKKDAQRLPDGGGDRAQTYLQIKFIHFQVYCWIQTAAPESDTQILAMPIVCQWCVDRHVAMPNGWQKWDEQLAAMPIICQQNDCCVNSNFCESMASQNNAPQRSSDGCWIVLRPQRAYQAHLGFRPQWA